jgi:hypothetical protein
VTLDSDSVVINFDFGNSDVYPNWSVNVHQNNLYYANTLNNNYAVSRISGSWWMADGSDLNKSLFNLVTFKVVNPESNESASVSAFIHQASETGTIDLSWAPPYMDVHQNSFLQIPFDYNSYSAGNDLTFDVELSDKNVFNNVWVIKGRDITVNFNPKPGYSSKNKMLQQNNDKNFVSIQFVAGGGAATVTKDGQLQIYGCEDSQGVLNCNGVLKDTIAIKGDPITEIFYKSFGGSNTQAYANTFAKGGDKRQGQTFIYTAFRHLTTNPVLVNNVEYLANDIAFSETVNGDLYVAFSFLHKDVDPSESQSFVEVYKIDPAAKDVKMTLVKKLTYAEVQAEDERDFCPTQIQFCPVHASMLHIMSDCKIKDYMYSRNTIYTYRIIPSKDFSNTSQVSFDLHKTKEMTGSPRFCPFANNFLVYSLEDNAVLAIDKMQTLSMYTIPLAALGLENLEQFDCMSSIGMYALGGRSSQTNGTEDAASFNYGLFNGDHEYNNDKFVNSLFQYLHPADHVDGRSYGVTDNVMTVSYSADYSKYSVRQTSVKPPVIFAETSDLKTQTTVEETYKLTLTASNYYGKESATTELVAKKQDMRFRWEGLKKWNKATERVYVERFTRLLGPIKSVDIAGPQKSQVVFAGRSKSDGSMNPSGEQIVFDEYIGTLDRGIALTWPENSEDTKFSLITNGKITEQYDLPLVSTADFVDVKSTGTNRLVLVNMAESSGEKVHAFIVDDNVTHVTISPKSTGTRADKLRVIHFPNFDQGPDKYLGYGLDSTTGVLTVWDITLVNGTDITFTVIDVITKVQDFDTVANTKNVYVFFVKYEESEAYQVVYTPADEGFDVSPISTTPFDK